MPFCPSSSMPSLSPTVAAALLQEIANRTALASHGVPVPCVVPFRQTHRCAPASLLGWGMCPCADRHFLTAHDSPAVHQRRLCAPYSSRRWLCARSRTPAWRGWHGAMPQTAMETTRKG